MPSAFFGVGCVVLCALAAPGMAQDSAPPKHEFRGAWIATVVNLDWPALGVHSSFQIASLRNMLDDLKAAGVNAVLFQIRSEADAMYDSDIEPWSYWLSGEQGTPPDPYFDPLELAVEEAHKRGMELHAWFNPYRAVRGSGYENDSSHVSVVHPEWMLTFGSIVIQNPGLPEVRDHIVRVVSDVVRRYDIDGVHFDDYFYPYPPNHISDEDEATFAEHNGGFVDIGDWRRDNVNLFVAAVADSVRAIKPDVKFGISPFGIWKNGVPTGISGLDAYNVIFADATAWLAEESIDYLTPQLYWPFGGGQDYAKLAPWWNDQMNGRHLYVGHGLYRSDDATYSGTLFSASEIPNQVRFNRDADIPGSVFFRARNLTVYPSKGFADTLKTDLYHHPALTPTMAWKDQREPSAAGQLSFEWTGDDELTLAWGSAAVTGNEAEAKRYAVYRVSQADPPLPDFAMDEARNLLAVVGDTTLVDRPEVSDHSYYYFVTSVSANSIESSAGNIVSAEGRAVAVAGHNPDVPGVTLEQNYPNPFRESTEIAFRLDRPSTVTLGVYNMLGQLVTTLVDRRRFEVGLYTVTWDGTGSAGQRVSSGVYFYVIESDGFRASRTLVVIR